MRSVAERENLDEPVRVVIIQPPAIVERKDSSFGLDSLIILLFPIAFILGELNWI